MAPTGYGKTEAALLPILSRILHERDRLKAANKPWPTGFKALYITPLRALNRDLLGRLTDWAEALDIHVGVRHGDTSQAERARQARKPPDVLITTPETLQLLLYGDTLRRHLATVRFVVLDEVHDLAASERGSQLTIALERLEEAIAQPPSLRDAPARDRTCPRKPSARQGGAFQRIGLSATVADPEPVARFMAGTDRAVQVLRVAAEKRRELDVVLPEVTDEDQRLGGELSISAEAAAEVRTVRALVAAHERVLVFCNTRDSAELLVHRSTTLDEDAGRALPLLELHHGSLSSEHRADVEDRFKNGDIRGLVATSSLELGIDVGAIDHVVQLGSPRSVARLVQRLGRAGHRVGATSHGTLVASGPEDFQECYAVARKAETGTLEPLRIREAPLVVLANQLVALTNEYKDLDRSWTHAIIRRAAPFAELDDGLFEQVWETLLDVRTVYESESAPGSMGRSGRSRKHFLSHISLIQDDKKFRILNEATKRSIGTVDDAFVAAGLEPGQSFIMAGRSWRVLEIEQDARRVRVAPARDLGAVPQWAGSALPVSRELAHAVAILRGNIGDGSAPTETAPGAGPVLAHLEEGLRVPTDRVVCLETGRALLVAHVPLGTRGNEALGRLTAALLSQRHGSAVPVDSDAYRITFTLPSSISPADVEETWNSLDPDSLDILLGIVLKGDGLLRHHLVHVAKHFGALPDTLDANRFTRAKLDALWDRLALQEETLNRLIHDRFDLDAMADFLRDLAAGRIEIVRQALGPLSRLALEEARRMVAPPRSDDKLLAQVRARIEESECMLVCTNCGTRTDTIVQDVPRRIHCRRCQNLTVACLRRWSEDKLGLLKGDQARLTAEEKRERNSMVRNGNLMANFGSVAARCLVARGVGPETATRILQKVSDPETSMFWREILAAELEFARTNAYWRR